MWNCKKCNEVLEDNFDTCYKCYESSDDHQKYLDDEKKENEKKKNINKKERLNFFKNFLNSFRSVILALVITFIISAILFFIGVRDNGLIFCVMFMSAYYGFKTDFRTKK